MDAKVAAKEADWAEVDFAEVFSTSPTGRSKARNWRCSTPSTPAPTPTNSPRLPTTRSPHSGLTVMQPRSAQQNSAVAGKERLTPCPPRQHPKGEKQ